MDGNSSAAHRHGIQDVSISDFFPPHPTTCLFANRRSFGVFDIPTPGSPHYPNFDPAKKRKEN
ncbi:hypothetical protein IC582_007407 [Cucumis melo]